MFDAPPTPSPSAEQLSPPPPHQPHSFQTVSELEYKLAGLEIAPESLLDDLVVSGYLHRLTTTSPRRVVLEALKKSAGVSYPPLEVGVSEITLKILTPVPVPWRDGGSSGRTATLLHPSSSPGRRSPPPGSLSISAAVPLQPRMDQPFLPA